MIGLKPVPYFLQGVDRVMRVLDCFTMETPELRLTDLSERLGMPKVQVLRIVTTLQSGGYLARDPETKRYRLGIRLFHLGMVVRQEMDLRRIAQPHLRSLADETQETAGLFVPDALGPICIDVIQSPKGTRVFAQLGSRMPWNAGTSSKVILAHLPEEDREQILARGRFRRFTEKTITNPNTLRELLADIRRAGHHVSECDLDEYSRGIGAPIFDDTGQIVAAIAVAAPEVRLPETEVVRFVDLARSASMSISHELGYRPPAKRIAADD